MLGTQTAVWKTTKQNGGDITALYARLSRDDEIEGDSNSIVHMHGSMVLKIHDSMQTTGIAERISIDPIFKE